MKASMPNSVSYLVIYWLILTNYSFIIPICVWWQHVCRQKSLIPTSYDFLWVGHKLKMPSPSLVLKKGWKLKSATDKTSAACDFLYVDCILQTSATYNIWNKGNFVKISIWVTTTVVVEMQQMIAQLSKYINIYIYIYIKLN